MHHESIHVSQPEVGWAAGGMSGRRLEVCRDGGWRYVGQPELRAAALSRELEGERSAGVIMVKNRIQEHAQVRCSFRVASKCSVCGSS